MKSKNQNPFLIAIAAGLVVTTSTTNAADGTWNVDANGLWSLNTNWASSIIANDLTSTANFTNNITADRTVSLDTDRTINRVNFSDANTATAGSWILNNNAVATNNLILSGTTGAATGTVPVIDVGALGTGKTATISAIIEGSYGFTKTGTGTLVLSGANSNLSGNVTILSGTVDQKTSTAALGSGTLVIGGTGGVNPIFQTGVNNSNAVQINANTTGTSIIAVNGVGSGSVMSGAITLNSANLNVRTFSAGTTAGVTLSGGVTGTGNLLINNLSNGTAATGKVTLSGTTINNSGTVTSQGTGPTANVISAVIGANVTNVTQNSATTGLNLTAVNLYTGSTTITAGTLQISGSGKLNNGNYAGAISVATSSTLRYSSSAAQTFSGNITGLGALTKDTGTASKLILSGTNTYTGATTVSAGTLAVNGSLANTSTTVGSGGTLQGSGSMGGSVTVQSGGKIAAGNSIESLATGALSLLAGSTFAYEMNNDAAASVAGDLTAITGSMTFDVDNAALLTLTELGTGSWGNGDKLTLLSYSGAWNGGLFNYASSTLADDSTFTFSGMQWAFNYNDAVAGTNYTGDLTGSSFVTMTAVPEPDVAALVGGLGALVLLRRRRN
jgi:autotransporter-associated beta strand protein